MSRCEPAIRDQPQRQPMRVELAECAPVRKMENDAKINAVAVRQE
jgi:hypothetical protein